jgi:hypothetical protein
MYILSFCNNTNKWNEETSTATETHYFVVHHYMADMISEAT